MYITSRYGTVNLMTVTIQSQSCMSEILQYELLIRALLSVLSINLMSESLLLYLLGYILYITTYIP